MAFEIKKKTDTPSYDPDEKRDWCLQKERELGIGRHMQFMSTEVRMQKIKREQADKESKDRWQTKRAADDELMAKNKIEFKKKWGMT